MPPETTQDTHRLLRTFVSSVGDSLSRLLRESRKFTGTAIHGEADVRSGSAPLILLDTEGRTLPATIVLENVGWSPLATVDPGLEIAGHLFQRLVHNADHPEGAVARFVTPPAALENGAIVEQYASDTVRFQAITRFNHTILNSTVTFEFIFAVE